MPRGSGPFWTFFSTLPIGAVLFEPNKEGFVEVNDAACALLGYDWETLSRMKVSDVDVGRSPDAIRIDRRSVTPHSTTRTVSTQLRRADGRLLHIDAIMQGIMINGRLFGCSVWTDVTERELAVAALRARERDLARVQRIGRVGGYEIDLRNGFGGRRSPESWRLNGLPEDTQNEPLEAWLKRLHPEDRDRMAEHFYRVVASDATHYEAEYRIVLPDGEIRWLSSVAEIERDADGHGIRMVGVHVDVTALRKAELAIANHVTRLAEIDRRKNEFLSMLGHELRTPLAPIMAVIERLQTAGDTAIDAAGRKAAYDVIHRQATHLRGLVDELLDIARITTGKIELTRESVDLRDVVDASIEQVRSLIDSQRHRLQISLPDQPVSVFGDGTRLIQALANLLDNAARYTAPEGDIAIFLSVDPNDRLAVVEIRDTGSGISADILPMISDLFVRGHQDQPSVRGEIGLGLTLVQRLIALHGGTIEVRTGYDGSGTRIFIRLPMRQPMIPATVREVRAPDDRVPASSAVESPRLAAAVAVTAPVSTPDFPRVVLVDDNADAADSMAELLRVTGHEVTVRHDGEGLLEVVRSERPQVVILDIGLPVRDGYALAREVRGSGDVEQPVLVALTGYGLEDDRRRSSEAGFDHHMVKPVDFQALRRIIAAAVQTGSGSA